MLATQCGRKLPGVPRFPRFPPPNFPQRWPNTRDFIEPIYRPHPCDESPSLSALIARINSYNLLFIAIYCHREICSAFLFYVLMCGFFMIIISALTLGARSVNRHMTSGCKYVHTRTIKSQLWKRVIPDENTVKLNYDWQPHGGWILSISEYILFFITIRMKQVGSRQPETRWQGLK